MLFHRGRRGPQIFKIIESATKERRRLARSESRRRPRSRPRRPAEEKRRPTLPFDGPYAAIGQAAILRLGRRAAPEQTAAVGVETDSTMTSASPAEHERAHGLAVFAAARFLLGMGLIAVLERVGAPTGFVQALGPLLALVGLCVIGVLTRAPNLLDFLAARRSAPTFYGGLAFAATAAGLVMAMASASGGVSSLPWRGVILGLAGAALLVAPALRGAKASAPAGLLATAFPQALTRVVLALALAAAGLLTAIAGFELAADTLVGAIGADRRFAEALVMLTLALSIVPGGFKGLVWTDAACGGGALLIAAVGAGVAIPKMPSPFAPLAALVNSGVTQSVLGGPNSAIWGEVATVAAIAGFFVLTPPAIGARTVGQARRIGFAGLVLAGAGLALAGIALPYFGALPEGPSRTAVGLIRAGVLGASRAGGIDLATAYSRLAVLSSRRIALNRLGMFAAIALCPWGADMRFLNSGRALFLALAIGLAFVTPCLLLALVARPPGGAAAAALGVALVAAVARFEFMGSAPRGPELLIGSLIVGAASFVTGMAFALIFPRAAGRAQPQLADPFVDIPLDGID